MLFNSFAFLVFFPLVAVGYFSLPQGWGRPWLLAASCVFYMAFIPAYILVLVVLILVDYGAGLGIERAHGARRKALLLASLTANLGMLGFFKYYNFLNENIAELFHRVGVGCPLRHLDIMLPIGLSFHTFQSLAYVIEVYRGRYRAERNLGVYALYVLFFPQMVAGPIERPQHLLNQLRHHPTFDHERVVSGLTLMLFGFFQKLVIADRLAPMVKNVYSDPTGHAGIELLIASYGFAYQIYCDFSGYSCIAIGAARVLGFDLMKNFDRPYSSRSISEFWHRWHISLSSWFRDYLYIPLGGNRVGPCRWAFNILIVFVLSGLWHGASWTFVAWGALNGLYLIFGTWTAAWRGRARAAIGLEGRTRLKEAVQTLVTFHLVVVGWVFFRSATMAQAFSILGRMLPLHHGYLGRGWDWDLGLDWYDLAIAVTAISALEMARPVKEWISRSGGLRARPIWCRWSVYYAAAFGLLFFGKFTSTEFIYFQF
jgi:alginate O-acetyltransferase complex protein AlgI